MTAPILLTEDGVDITEWHCSAGHRRCDCTRPVIDAWGNGIPNTGQVRRYLPTHTLLNHVAAHIHERETRMLREHRLSALNIDLATPLHRADAMEIVGVGGVIVRNESDRYRVVDADHIARVFSRSRGTTNREGTAYPAVQYNRYGWRIHELGPNPNVDHTPTRRGTRQVDSTDSADQEGATDEVMSIGEAVRRAGIGGVIRRNGGQFEVTSVNTVRNNHEGAAPGSNYPLSIMESDGWSVERSSGVDPGEPPAQRESFGHASGGVGGGFNGGSMPFIVSSGSPTIGIFQQAPSVTRASFTSNASIYQTASTETSRGDYLPDIVDRVPVGTVLASMSGGRYRLEEGRRLTFLPQAPASEEVIPRWPEPVSSFYPFGWEVEYVPRTSLQAEWFYDD